MQSRPVYVSTTSFARRDLRSIVALCDEGRIEGLELSAVETCDLEMLGTTTYPSRFLVHNYFPPADPPFVLNLASRDSTMLERSRQHCRAAIDLSSQLGGDVYAAHAGYTADLPPELLGDPVRQSSFAGRLAPRAEAYRILVESAELLAAYARDRGVRFLVENHVLAQSAGSIGRDLLLMFEPVELERLAADVRDQSFGLLIDVGHLKVSANTVGFDAGAALDALAPSVVGLHLSDNDGLTDTHSPFGDEAWFLPKIVGLAGAALTVELAGQSLERILATQATVARWCRDPKSPT